MKYGLAAVVVAATTLSIVGVAEASAEETRSLTVGPSATYIGTETTSLKLTAYNTGTKLLVVHVLAPVWLRPDVSSFSIEPGQQTDVNMRVLAIHPSRTKDVVRFCFGGFAAQGITTKGCASAVVYEGYVAPVTNSTQTTQRIPWLAVAVAAGLMVGFAARRVKRARRRRTAAWTW